MDDPFTQIHRKLWEVVETYEPLVALVKSGNRINFVKEGPDVDPRKTGISYSDSPELMLIPDFFESSFDIDNTQSEITRTFNWVIRTTRAKLNTGLYPVEWELFKALKAGRKIMIKELSFVRDCQVVRGSARIPNVDVGKYGDKGALWLSLWSMRVVINVD